MDIQYMTYNQQEQRTEFYTRRVLYVVDRDVANLVYGSGIQQIKFNHRHPLSCGKKNTQMKPVNHI